MFFFFPSIAGFSACKVASLERDVKLSLVTSNNSRQEHTKFVSEDDRSGIQVCFTLKPFTVKETPLPT